MATVADMRRALERQPLLPPLPPTLGLFSGGADCGVVPLPGGRSIPVDLDGHGEMVKVEGIRARCRYCHREGLMAEPCQGCGASSWGPVATLSNHQGGGLPKPSPGTPRSS